MTSEATMNMPARAAAAPVQVSFEFFPPKTAAMEANLWKAVRRLAPLGPRFVSVTYGADGSTRDRTHHIVTSIVRDTGLASVPHLTCVGATREEVLAIARRYWDEGIRQIVALRGDPPAGQASYTPFPGGFAYANELVTGLKEVADFDISVAAYPDTHPEAPSPDHDIAMLKRKFDAGASRAITQFFYDPDAYLRFRDRCVAAGITGPIVPGLLPINKFSQMLAFATRCGARVPAWLHQRFEGLDEDPETRQMIAASVAIELVGRLRRHGVSEFHFYTLNRAELTYAICYALGLRPREEVQA